MGDYFKGKTKPELIQALKPLRIKNIRGLKVKQLRGIYKGYIIKYFPYLVGRA